MWWCRSVHRASVGRLLTNGCFLWVWLMNFRRQNNVVKNSPWNFPFSASTHTLTTSSAGKLGRFPVLPAQSDVRVWFHAIQRNRHLSGLTSAGENLQPAASQQDLGDSRGARLHTLFVPLFTSRYGALQSRVVHTVTQFCSDWSPQEKTLISAGLVLVILQLISNKRLFL